MRQKATSRDLLLSVTTEQALLWLWLGNGVGLLLALLLVFPRLGELLAPLSYGRLMPLHLNLELYGWCGLGLLVLLLRWLLSPETKTGMVSAAIAGWSLLLGLGAASWLAGTTSGKIFLDWRGAARLLLLAELTFLWLALARGWWLDRGNRPWKGSLFRGVVLASLAFVPLGLAVATSPATYPPINPQTGGPTGGSLLGSTLGLLGLFVACPYVLGLRRRRQGRWLTGASLGLLCLHSLGFAFLDHGDHSHHELAQNLAILSLLPWVAWLTVYFRAFHWPSTSRRWLGAFAAWAGLLVTTSALSFQPGILERLKFTHALVAHAHLAMAGMLTSFLLLAFTVLCEARRVPNTFAEPAPFWIWQLGMVLHLVALAGLGSAEASDPTFLLRGGPAVTALFSLRAAAGAAMFIASLTWWRGARQRRVELSPSLVFPSGQGEEPPSGFFEEAA